MKRLRRPSEPQECKGSACRILYNIGLPPTVQQMRVLTVMSEMTQDASKSPWEALRAVRYPRGSLDPKKRTGESRRSPWGHLGAEVGPGSHWVLAEVARIAATSLNVSGYARGVPSALSR
jgi:hypothetical protein